MIVEDEAIVSADIAGKLRNRGYEIVASTDTGEEAIDLTRRLRPALVLMDIHLAGTLDGIAAAEVIRQECQVPVVFLTAHADMATIRRAQQTEAFGYILKPFDDRDLHTQIEMALYKHAAEQRLRESRARLATFAAATFEGIVEIKAERIVDCNEQFARILGYTEAEIRGMEITGIIAPEDIDRVMVNIQKERESMIELDMLRKDGSRIIVEAHGRPMFRGRRITAIRDITEHRNRQEELQKLNRVLTALSHSSMAMMRATEETAYLQEICKSIVEDCGYAMVWIGYAENDPGCSVRPVASAGFEAGYLKTLNITYADTESGRGPTGSAIRTGNVCSCRNMQTDPQPSLRRLFRGRSRMAENTRHVRRNSPVYDRINIHLFLVLKALMPPI